MKIFAGYGSTKDISVYTSIGLPPSQIYIVGRPSKKMQHQCQVPFDHFCTAWEKLSFLKCIVCSRFKNAKDNDFNLCDIGLFSIITLLLTISNLNEY